MEPEADRCGEGDFPPGSPARPERLSGWSFPRPRGRQLRTTQVIERCFVECAIGPVRGSASSRWRAGIESFRAW
jgi:hypothetical protein